MTRQDMLLIGLVLAQFVCYAIILWYPPVDRYEDVFPYNEARFAPFKRGESVPECRLDDSKDWMLSRYS